MTLFRRQQRAPRLWLPSGEARDVGVDLLSAGASGAEQRRLRRPLRIGYGDDCDLRLDGASGPDVLLELQRGDQPLRLIAKHGSDDVDRCIELYVDGERVRPPVESLASGSHVEVLEKASGQRHRLLVDPPPDPPRRWWLRPRVMLGIVAALAVAGSLYATYFYVALERAEHRIEATRGEVTEAGERFDALLRRFESAESDYDASLAALQARLGEAELHLRSEFDSALAEIRQRAIARLGEVEARDSRGRAELERRTREEIDLLREEFADRMVEAYRDLKTMELRVTDAFARRMDALEPAGERFKRVFRRARDAVVFIRIRYEIEFTRTGDVTPASSFGTGYLVEGSGLGLSAQHVLRPWRYDRKLEVLRKLDLARVREDSVRFSVWTTGSRVRPADPEATDPAANGEPPSSGYHTRTGARLLYAPEPTLVNELIAAPVGMIRVEVPKPDHTDVAVFHLMAFDREFESISPADSATAVETLDESLVIGYPFSRLAQGVALPQGVRGSVRRVGPQLMELDTPLHPGLSGAPVLDDDGRLLGMVIAVLNSDVYGVAILATELRAALEAARVAIRHEEARLAAIGCDPGVVDDVVDANTAAAYACERQARGDK